MRSRITFALICALAVSAAMAASAFGQAAIAIYSNNMDSGPKRSQVVKLSGENCDRGGSSAALQGRRRQAHRRVQLPDPRDRA